MTLGEFGALLATVDPGTRRYYTASRGAYTTWQEYERINHYADGLNRGGWKVQVERYTQAENDPIAAQLYAMLEARDDVSVAYMVDSQDEDESTTIRHLFDCEVLD